jgi:uridine phosphorylase
MDFLPEDSESIVQPGAFVRYMARLRGIPEEELRLPTVGLLAVIPEEFEALKDMLKARKFKPFPAVRIAKTREGAFALIRSDMGAPAVTLVLEEAIALGVGRILFLGTCGSLNPALRPGDLLAPTGAIREEGTSHHYLPPDWEVAPSSDLCAALRSAADRVGVELKEGVVWTTDAPYRETVAKVEVHRASGVMAVEMETSAVLALAAYRNVSAASLLVVSDELFGKEWRPGMHEDRFKEGCEAARRLAAEACGALVSG